MRRREFIKVVAGLAVALPFAVRAQQPERMRRIGVLLGANADDVEFQTWVGAFLEGLQQAGWSIGQNVQIDTHWATSDAAGIRKHAAELVALAPDVILAHGTSTVAPLLQLTRTVPIVAPVFGDPVGAGFVDSLARPGGNVTGFMSTEYSMAAKWLELLKETAPSVTRVAILRDADQITQSIESFARAPNGGLIVAASGASLRHRDLIVKLAARYKLPTVYYERVFVTAGGLIAYGADFVDQYRRAAGYVDRILKGEKPADLPVQAPTKYELVINLKTAKALGFAVPASVLSRADEVIE